MNKEEKNLQYCATQYENPLGQSYWNLRWEKNETGWYQTDLQILP